MAKAMLANEKATTDKIDQLLKSGHLDPKEEEALKYCDEQYKDAINTIPVIENGISLGDPKYAEEGVISTQNEAQDCEGEFSKGTSPLTNENQKMIDLSVVTEAIIKILL